MADLIEELFGEDNKSEQYDEMPAVVNGVLAVSDGDLRYQRALAGIVRRSVAPMSAPRDIDMQNNEESKEEEEEADKIKGDWEFLPFDDDDWSTVVEEPSDDPDFCFFCNYVQADKEKEHNPYYQKFVQFLNDYYPKMKRKVLGIKAQGLYNKYFRLIHGQPEGKHMRAITIIEHLEEHAPTALIQVHRMNKILNKCTITLAAQLQQRDKSTGNRRLHPNNTGLYMKLVDKQNEVLAKLSKLR